MAASPGLFERDVPPGFHYRDHFITEADERVLLDAIADVAFADFEMHGAVARRRVAFFGHSYDASLGDERPMPEFLRPLAARFASCAGVAGDAFAMALINEYRPGAPIGWHRDAPQYDIVAGLSLLSPCRMKFRRYVAPSAHAGAGAPRRSATHEVTLEPRSAYLMTGPSRSQYEHHIPAVSALRYSITFRTLRHD